jgi:nucleotide-binding universal stress UspA family protein
MSWFPKKKIVVPVDFSDRSLAAIDTALALVDDPSHMLVVHVLQDLSLAEPGEIWRSIDRETRARHAAKTLRERLPDEKYGRVLIEIRHGDPGQEIADLAQREGAELIVLPSHGRTGLKRLLIGSVAERVVRLAHCPVLVLRE